MNSRIFVSYSYHDRKVADRIIESLAQHGISTWSDNYIQAGTNWADELVSGIEKADVFLFLVSPNSLASRTLHKELEMAITLKKRVVPVLIGNIDQSNMPLSLKRYKSIDLRQGVRQDIHQLVKFLGESIGSEPVEVERRNKGYVFLSYAEDDRGFVIKLKEFLKEKGYAYWDYDESDRDYHNQIVLELEEAILGSAALFAVLSENWKKSKWTVREYIFAEDASIPVFLLRAKPIGPTLAIAGIPYIDFEKDDVRGFEKLDKELRRKNL